MKLRSGLVIACAIGIASSIPSVDSSAAVIQADDSVFGVDAVVRDTSLGRDFLRLDFTVRRALVDVQAELGAGGEFSGWAIASSADLFALGTSAGIAPESPDPLQVAAADQLRDWFCFACVQTTPSHVYAHGTVSDTITLYTPGGTPELTYIQRVVSVGRRINVSPNTVTLHNSGTAPAEFGQTGLGIFLTRASVPEPAVWAQLALGAILLVARSSSRRAVGAQRETGPLSTSE